MAFAQQQRPVVMGPCSVRNSALGRDDGVAKTGISF